jgi:hypothetical protein
VDIILKPKRVALGFSAVVVFLTLANIGSVYIALHYRVAELTYIARLVDVTTEGNLPAYYSFFALLFCSALLLVITRSKRRDGDPYAPHWFWLAVIFLFLSMDEALSIHEFSSYLVILMLDTSGTIDTFQWLIPYGIFVLVFALAYLRFLTALPGKTRWLFVTAGVVFVAGAWGFKLLAEFIFETPLRRSAEYMVLSSVEEFLEMSGVVVFIYALTSYIDSEAIEERIRIISDEGEGPDGLPPVNPP